MSVIAAAFIFNLCCHGHRLFEAISLCFVLKWQEYLKRVSALTTGSYRTCIDPRERMGVCCATFLRAPERGWRLPFPQTTGSLIQLAVKLFKNKEPPRPICLSRQTLRWQCVTNSTPTLSCLISFSLLFLCSSCFFTYNPVNSSHLVNFYCWFFVFFCHIFPWSSFPCLLWCFSVFDFYGDTALPRNNGG